MCYHLRQARQTTLGESGVAELAECNIEGIKVQCTVLFIYNITEETTDTGYYDPAGAFSRLGR